MHGLWQGWQGCLNHVLLPDCSSLACAILSVCFCLSLPLLAQNLRVATSMASRCLFDAVLHLSL